jgi:hypothetical protein
MIEFRYTQSTPTRMGMQIMSAKTQLRGNCQMCGRERAIVNGRMAKHGYTVENGWFQGVCQGDNHEPMQVSRTATDEMIVSIRADAAKLDQRAADLKSGIIVPGPARASCIPNAAMVEYNELPDHRKPDVLSAAIWAAEMRARHGRAFAKQMGELADKLHGTALRIVEPAAKAAPIVVGERRTLTTSSGPVVLICYNAKGARIHWRFESDAKRRGCTGSQAWRTLPMA